jgi:hypothetical protein
MYKSKPPDPSQKGRAMWSPRQLLHGLRPAAIGRALPELVTNLPLPALAMLILPPEFNSSISGRRYKKTTKNRIAVHFWQAPLF